MRLRPLVLLRRLPLNSYVRPHLFTRSFYWLRIVTPDRMEIKLTEEENMLCNLLDECTRCMKETEGIETSCRIAGGWVRDKVRSSSRSLVAVVMDLLMYVWALSRTAARLAMQ